MTDGASTEPTALPASLPEAGPGHLQRNAIGYATIVGVCTAYAEESLQVRWPANAHDWTLFALGLVAVAAGAVGAYRAKPLPSSKSSLN